MIESEISDIAPIMKRKRSCFYELQPGNTKESI